MQSEFLHKIFAVNPDSFEGLALEVFRFQYENNPLYRQFVDALGTNPSQIESMYKIPFLPLSFFKSHAVKTTAFEPEVIFESSGTTGMLNSKHFVKDISLYTSSFLTAFESFYGDPGKLCIIALLPSYLERKNSSLVTMADVLIRKSSHPESGFYLYDYKKLHRVLQELESQKQPTLLLGVTYALLDFASAHPMNLKHTIVMETGGMKGRKEELTRQEVHEQLQLHLGVETIHSEYGMTELLSQAYSKGNGIFTTPPWMRMLVRDEDDPLLLKAPGAKMLTIPGVLNIIDLANLYSCAFLATDDAGKLAPDGSFEVTGRIDASDIRGCSLMLL